MWISLLLTIAGSGLPTRTLDSLLISVSQSRGGTASAAVVRVRDGCVLWEHDSWRRMLPASTQKVLSAAVLHSILGGNTLIPTRILRTGAWKDSALAGDIVLEGGGDPSFARGSDSLVLDRIARDLRGAGLRRVRGALVVRDPLVKRADRMWPGSWDWDNSLTDCDGAPSAGISVYGNCPGDSSLAFPHRKAAQAFRTALAHSGIVVEGGDRFELGVVSLPSDSVLAVHRSAVVDSLLAQALAKSSNHDIETLGLLAGASDSISSRDGGLQRVRNRLLWLGLDTTRTHLDDLCGLSRKNAITTLDMAAILAKIVRDTGMNIVPLLPEPGKGTLKIRFRKTLPPGTRLKAKTGSLDGVSTLVGVLVPPGGDSLAFALFFEGHAGAPTAIRFAQEQIVGVLAGGPVVAPTTQDTTPSIRKPVKTEDRPTFLDP